MARRSAEHPAYNSEAEEADWYATPKGREQTRREFERALRTGKATRSAGASIPHTDPEVLARLMEQAKVKATKAISIRLPIADLELAKRIAATQGIGYQSVLKRAIRKGLNRAV